MKKITFWVLSLLISLPAVGEDNPIAIPDEFGKTVGLEEYLNLALKKSLERQAADISLTNAGMAHELFHDNYLPRPTLSASQSTNASAGEDDRSVSRSQSAGLKWTGNTPYGVTWGVTTPQFSKTRSETGGDFSNTTTSHSAQIGANVSVNLLRDSYFVLGRRKDLKAALTHKNAVLNHRDTLLEIVKNAQSKFFALIFQYTTLEIQRDSVKDAKILIKNTEIKYQEGESDKLAILQARLKSAQAKNGLIESEEAFQKSYEDFIQIIDPNREGNDRVFPDPAILTKVPKRPGITLQKAVKMAEANQPKYNVSKNNFAMQKISLTESRSALWPSLQLTSSYGWAGADQGGWEAFAQARRGERKTATVGLSLSYIPWNNPAETGYKSARNSYRQAKHEFNQLRTELVTQLSSQLKTVDNAFRKLKTSDLSLELSRQKLEAEKFKYKEGVATIKDVIDFQNEYEQSRIGVMRARAEIYVAITDLRATLGNSHREIGSIEYESSESKEP